MRAASHFFNIGIAYPFAPFHPDIKHSAIFFTEVHKIIYLGVFGAELFTAAAKFYFPDTVFGN